MSETSRGLNPDFSLEDSINHPQPQKLTSETAEQSRQDTLEQGEDKARKETQEEMERLKSEQITNPLTGLPNKKALEEFSNIFDARPYDIIVTYIDLNNFGEINRKLGHDQADQKIRDFGKFFKNEIRQSDFLFHLHGDEFVLLSPKRNKVGEETTPEEGLKHHLEVMNDNSEVKFGSISITFDKNKHPSLLDAVNEADKNLMDEKERIREQKS